MRQNPAKANPANDRKTKIRAFPAEQRKLRHTPSTVLLGLLAFVMVCGAAVAQYGSQLHGSLAVVGEKLATTGLEPGILFVGGLVLFGVSVACRQLRVHASTILKPGPVEEVLTEVGADLAEFRNKLYDLANDQIQLRTMIQQVRHDIEEHHKNDRMSEVVEATFRLAGSLDTLLAQIDQRLEKAAGGLHDSIHELSALVEASRDFLQESFEESGLRSSELATEIATELRELQSLRESFSSVAAPREESWSEESAESEAPAMSDVGTWAVGSGAEYEDDARAEMYDDASIEEEEQGMELGILDRLDSFGAEIPGSDREVDPVAVLEDMEHDAPDHEPMGRPHPLQSLPDEAGHEDRPRFSLPTMPDPGFVSEPRTDSRGMTVIHLDEPPSPLPALPPGLDRRTGMERRKGLEHPRQG